MAECSFLGWLNFFVLTVTGGVIAWYTVETFKLRREAQLNTELQNRPFLSLEIRGPHGPNAAVEIANIGKGLARGIAMIARSGETFEIRADGITHLAPGFNAIPKWTVFARVTLEDPRSEVPSEDSRPMAVNLITSQPFTIELTYASIAGQRYRTIVRVANGLAEIDDDRRLEDS